MICVSLFADQYQKYRNKILKADYIEIRLDNCDISKSDLKEMIQFKKKIIIACKNGHRPESERFDLITRLIKSNIDFVDIDIDSPKEFLENIMKTAKLNNCKVILSYHNFETTPEKIKLMEIIKKGLNLKADIVKIATMVKTKNHIKRIISLYDNKNLNNGNKLLAFGMGKKGKITRIITPFIGAPYTYVTLEGMKKTAEYQLDFERMKEIKDLIKNETGEN